MKYLEYIMETCLVVSKNCFIRLPDVCSNHSSKEKGSLAQLCPYLSDYTCKYES